MDGTLALKKYNVVERLEALEEGGGGGGYVLPVASADTLGGVKVGNGLSIDAETGVLSASGQSWDYSTNEVNTGQKWVDGSDIFCKVYNNIQLTNGTDVTVDANFGSDKNVVKIEGMGTYAQNDENTFTSLGNYLTGNDKVVPKVSAGVFLVEVKDNWSAWTSHFTIYYTKIQPTRKKK